MISAESLDALHYLENVTGHFYDGMPIGPRDQWEAGLRDVFATEGVDIGDPEQARAAFTGAMAMAQVLFPHAHLPMRAAQHAVAAMSMLADRA